MPFINWNIFQCSSRLRFLFVWIFILESFKCDRNEYVIDCSFDICSKRKKVMRSLINWYWYHLRLIFEWTVIYRMPVTSIYYFLALSSLFYKLTTTPFQPLELYYLKQTTAHFANNGEQQWVVRLKCKLVHKSGHYIIVSYANWRLLSWQ